MKRIFVALVCLIAVAAASPAEASLDDQFPCRSPDHASLLVAITAFAPDKAVLQVMELEDGVGATHELALKPGGSWQDFRYEDGDGRVFAGGNGKGVLLLKSRAYFCEYAGDAGEYGAGEAQVRIRLSDQGLEISRPGGDVQTESHKFGERKADVVAALWMAFGAPGEESANAECGAGPMTFQRFGPFTVNFMEDEWVGWSLDQGMGSRTVTVALANGAGIGSPVSVLEGKPEWLEESTLGNEFTARGISGLSSGLHPNAAIETLWAGANCHFR